MSDSLTQIFDGWNGYQQSIVNAIRPLTSEQLAWRPAENQQSIGELVRHIALGRISWFARMNAPGSQALVEPIQHWETDRDGNRHIVETAIEITEDAEALVHWLEITWKMIDETLNTWTTADLEVSYQHVWNGNTYANSRQWTLWRILNHDIHHGGELSLMLGLNGIEAFELSGLFGHIITPPLADPE